MNPDARMEGPGPPTRPTAWPETSPDVQNRGSPKPHGAEPGAGRTTLPRAVSRSFLQLRMEKRHLRRKAGAAGRRRLRKGRTRCRSLCVGGHRLAGGGRPAGLQDQRCPRSPGSVLCTPGPRAQTAPGDPRSSLPPLLPPAPSTSPLFFLCRYFLPLLCHSLSSPKGPPSSTHRARAPSTADGSRGM